MGGFVKRNILDVSNRRTGKTFHLVQKVKEAKGIMVCASREEAERVSSKYKIRTISINDVERGKLLGDIRPTFYDQDCILVIEQERLNHLEDLETKDLQIKKLGEAVQHQKDIIRDNQNQIEELNDDLGNKVRMLHMAEQAEDEANKFSLKSKEKIEKLEAELKRERDTVDFYADKNNWDQADGYDFDCIINNDCRPFNETNCYYGGKLARETQQQRVKE